MPHSMQEHLFDRPLAHLINALPRFRTTVHANIDSRPPKINHFAAHMPATHSYVRQASAALTRDDLQDMDHSVPKKPISPSPPSQARPPLLNCRENSKLVVLNHHVAKTHTTKAPRPPAPFAPPTKTAPARRISRQIKCFILCHIT